MRLKKLLLLLDILVKKLHLIKLSLRPRRALKRAALKATVDAQAALAAPQPPRRSWGRATLWDWRHDGEERLSLRLGFFRD